MVAAAPAVAETVASTWESLSFLHPVKTLARHRCRHFTQVPPF